MKLVATRSLGDQAVAGMTADEIADAVMKLNKVCVLSCWHAPIDHRCTSESTEAADLCAAGAARIVRNAAQVP